MTAKTPALAALERAKVAHTVRAYRHDPAAAGDSGGYGMEAVLALGADPQRVFKTLIAEVDGAMVVAIVPVTGKLDLKALAAAVNGKRASMADPRAAEKATGYVVGGISPLGQKKRLPTVLDASALAQPTILVSAGRRGLDVELSPAELVALTSATTAPIAALR